MKKCQVLLTKKFGFKMSVVNATRIRVLFLTAQKSMHQPPEIVVSSLRYCAIVLLSPKRPT